MLAVNCMRNCWTATSYAECHRNGCIHAACSPGCRPLGSHSRLATIPSATPRSLHRYKTLPARSPEGSPGTKLSPHTQKRRFRPTFRTQGESFHAHANNKPRRENFVPHARPVPVQNSPGTQPSGPTRYKTLPARSPADPPGIKLSQLAPFAGPPGTKLSRHARNTPFRRILRQQGEFYTASTNTKPSRAKKVTRQHPTSPQ